MNRSIRAWSRGAAALPVLVLALVFAAPAAALGADPATTSDLSPTSSSSLTTTADPTPTPSVAPDPTPTPDPSASPTPSPDPSPSSSPSPDPSASPTPSPDPSASPSPEPSPSPAPGPSPAPEPAPSYDSGGSGSPATLDALPGKELAGVAGVVSPPVERWSAWAPSSTRGVWVRGFWSALRAGQTVTGRASWYPGTRGWRGVPAVALPGAWYRPRGTATKRVEVCNGRKCLIVPVVDLCDCYANSSTQRVADLSRPLARRLGLKLHRGLYKVTIRLIAPTSDS